MQVNYRVWAKMISAVGNITSRDWRGGVTILKLCGCNKECDSILISMAASFQARPLPFSFCPRPEQADKKAHLFPPLVLVESSRHVSPGLCAGTLTPVPPTNHHKTLSQSLFLALSIHFPTCLGTCSDLLGRSHYVSSTLFHTLLTCVYVGSVVTSEPHFGWSGQASLMR